MARTSVCAGLFQHPPSPAAVGPPSYGGAPLLRPVANRLETPGNSIPRQEKQQELESLLRAGIVREGTQLHALLTYLGQKALDEHGEPLKEYTIGVEALRKPADYDPRLDPSVRVEVGRLRNKLKEYYQRQRAPHVVRLEIPKGGYNACFVRASGGASSWASRALVRALLGAALVALAALLGWFARDRALPRPAASLGPALSAFWSPHLQGRTPTLFVYGAPMFLKLDASFLRDPHVNRAEEIEGHAELTRLIGFLKPGEIRPVYHFTGFGEAEALFLLTRLLASAGAQVSARRSNNAGWEDLKGQHVVLLGGRKFNPQIPDLPYPFQFECIPRRIVNHKPAKDDPSDYVTVSKEPHSELLEEYSLISVYPGLAPNTRLIVLEASSSEGTAAAGEFLAREDILRDLFAKMRLPPEAGRLPTSFQVVVRARLKSGIPIAVSYVTHAVLP